MSHYPGLGDIVNIVNTEQTADLCSVIFMRIRLGQCSKYWGDTEGHRAICSNAITVSVVQGNTIITPQLPSIQLIQANHLVVGDSDIMRHSSYLIFLSYLFPSNQQTPVISYSEKIINIFQDLNVNFSDNSDKLKGFSYSALLYFYPGLKLNQLPGRK